MASPREDVQARIDDIESSYEFFLAYAAQGVSSDRASKSGGQLRDFLTGMEEALDRLADCLRELVRDGSLSPPDAWADFLDVVERDAGAARAAVRLVQAQDEVSSQLVDNLNVNVHVRALLTDLFLLDELLG